MHAQYRIELSLAGMIDGMQGDMPLSEKIDKLKEHRIRSRSCPRPLTLDIWPSTDQHIQVLVCDGSLVYCSRGAENHRVDIRPADGSLPRRLDIPLPGVTHIEALDLAQELLIVSERTLGSQCVCSLEPAVCIHCSLMFVCIAERLDYISCPPNQANFIQMSQGRSHR